MSGHGEVAEALAAFDPIWETLSPREQTRVVHLLVGRVNFDGHREKVRIVVMHSVVLAMNFLGHFGHPHGDDLTSVLRASVTSTDAISRWPSEFPIPRGVFGTKKPLDL